MAKAKSSKVVTTVQPAYGAVGRVIVTKDKWLTEIDARMPIGGSEPIGRMMQAMTGTGQSAAFTATDDGYRLFTIVPNAIGKRVLAAAGI